MKMSDRFNLPMKVDGYSVESTPIRHHTYPCEVVSDIECDSGEDAKAVAHAINNHDVLVELLGEFRDFAVRQGWQHVLINQANEILGGES